ncbi:Os04g0450250, partial [Oryza sativa Japonica Group]
MHSGWNACEQCGSSRRSSPSSNDVRHTAHSSTLLPILCFTTSLYGTIGNVATTAGSSPRFPLLDGPPPAPPPAAAAAAALASPASARRHWLMYAQKKSRKKNTLMDTVMTVDMVRPNGVCCRTVGACDVAGAGDAEEDCAPAPT